MRVLVDTCIWSLVLRRKDPDQGVAKELTELIEESRLVVIGVIRQELLSGIKTTRQFEALRAHLSPFPDLPLDTAIYEKAAEYFNACRRKGVAGSHVDFLICSAAMAHDCEIYTSDPDFSRYERHLPISLYASA